MPSARFGCTGCGGCCQGLKLRLTFSEAQKWLESGQPVEVLVDATPWSEAVEPETAPEMQRKRMRSFAANSGQLPCRVEVILTSAYRGNCPRLDTSMRCTIYADRPTICRIYPASPLGAGVFNKLDKKCPPEAWAESTAPFIQGGKIVDADLQASIDHFNQAAIDDVPHKERLCALLDINHAAFVNQGYVAYAPTVERLRYAFHQTDNVTAHIKSEWTFVCGEAQTAELLERAGGLSKRAVGSSDASDSAGLGASADWPSSLASSPESCWRYLPFN